VLTSWISKFDSIMKGDDDALQSRQPRWVKVRLGC
jgi:hypothetical protein